MFPGRVYLLRVVVAFFCASALAPILLLSTASAAPRTLHAITVTSQTATESFPKGIDFQVSVQDNLGLIGGATLVLASQKPRYMDVQRVVPVATPQQKLTLHWHEDTTSSDSFVYPGTTLDYYWQFYDKTLQTYGDGQHSTFTVIDTRFNWQNLSQEQVQVHWYGQSTDFGQSVLSQAINNVRRISANLGGTLQHPVNLWVYQTPEDFRGSLPPGVHEWVGGIAFPSLDEASIVVDSLNADTLIRDMPHELTHLVFHQLTEHGILAPLWFDEGLAVYNQSYQEPEMTQAYKHALTTHTLLRLNTIAYTFPADANTAYLAYAQSWKLIGYMYTTFGQAKMAKLITLMDSTKGEFNDDLQQAVGEDTLHLENSWRVSLSQPPVLSPTDKQQTTPRATNTPQPVGTSDVTSPLLLFAGILLILLPITGLSTFFILQRRKQHRGLLEQQAQHVIATTFPPYGYMPYQPYPYQQQTHVNKPFEAQSSRPMPPMPPYNDATQANPPRYDQQFPGRPLQLNQDYTKQPPLGQAPQE